MNTAGTGYLLGILGTGHYRCQVLLVLGTIGTGQHFEGNYGYEYSKNEQYNDIKRNQIFFLALRLVRNRK